MNIAVKSENIIKDFDLGPIQIRVINNISLEIYQGELTMLVGPSGCGKTTLISIMSGILSATQGESYVMGVNLATLSDNEKAIFRRENIGFIFQQYNLLSTLTAKENAAITLLAANINEKEALERAREILNHIGMQNDIEKLPRQLSGGQQQRVAIARALVHNPKLIICDEPTAALDAKAGIQVMEILNQASNDKNRAVLVVTHDDRIFRFADRILEMSDGCIIGESRRSKTEKV
jgi:putative ABC transport system ATP-binding protein